jgi:hypothetical protein
MGKLSDCLVLIVGKVVGLTVAAQGRVILRFAGQGAGAAAHAFLEIYYHRILRHCLSST